MQKLVPLMARTARQLLKRLEQHFRSLPVPPGHPLAPIARAMPLVERTAEVVFLSRKNSVWVEHTILVLDSKVILDHNTYLHQRFNHSENQYTAVDLAGRPITLQVCKRMSVEDFIEETGLYDRFRVSKPAPEDMEDT